MNSSSAPAKFPIPVVAIGPGSQAEAEEPDFLPLPRDMHTFSMPVAHWEADPAVLGAACAVLSGLRERMLASPAGPAATAPIELDGLAPAVRELLDQSLGHGEVSILVGDPLAWRIQETIFTGVWRIQEVDAHGRVRADSLVAGSIPAMVQPAAEEAARFTPDPPLAVPGIMNAPAVLTELRDRSVRLRGGDSAHVLNLSLLPMSPEDLDYLARALGVGAVTMLSRGYGNCRVTSTRLAHVWWVHYFNSMNQLILNTLEVVEVPAVACAADEDYADSIERLGEWLTVMQSEVV